MTKIHTPQISPVAQTINENHQLRAQAERLKQSLAWEESTREQMAARLVTLYAELETEKATRAQAVTSSSEALADAERLRGENESLKRHYGEMEQEWDRLHEQLAIAELEVVRLQAKLKQADNEYGELFVDMADENENTLRLFRLANAAKRQAKRDARALEHIAALAREYLAMSFTSDRYALQAALDELAGKPPSSAATKRRAFRAAAGILSEAE